ncbi:peptide-methionine (S)-S-oxide reductase MsrA [Pectinatus sottacetonis]|uniref:peptide-methionine (S)-S-oxide reductase MsrA n=1 Tax=Pectinatus sottacetonis TaxID=1002795 RepID=UPI0018C5C0C7|nr:peptide-methionine (S)-S-oxide reductase MsrA [Pectinatus sottacetonis]
MNNHESNAAEIYLAGGCFWGLQAYIDKLSGIICTTVGYANGNTVNPTYQDVCSNSTGHTETVYVKYDQSVIQLETILKYFFKAIDPTAIDHQGNDFGTQYKTGIYYKTDCDKKIINKIVSDEQKKYTTPIATVVEPLICYYPAEEYHQKYLKKNPKGYCHINL